MGGKKNSKKKKGAPRNKEANKQDGYKKKREEVTLDTFREYFLKSDEKKLIDNEGEKAIGHDDDPYKKRKEEAIQIEESTATPITMAGKNNNLPSPSLPQGYVTLNMLQERYYKAQEQKRLDSERQEQEKDKRENINSKRMEKEVSVQIQKPATHTMTVKNDTMLPSRSLDDTTLNMIRDHYLKAEEQKLMYHAKRDTEKAGRNDGDLDKKGKKAAVWTREAQTSKMISRNDDNLPLPPLSNYVSLSMFHERHLKAQEQKCVDTDKNERERVEGIAGVPDMKWSETAVPKEEEAASSRRMAAVTDTSNLKLPSLPDGYVTLNMLRERYLKAKELKEAADKEAAVVKNREAEAVDDGQNPKNSVKSKEVKSLDSELIKQVENQKNIWSNSWKSKEAVVEEQTAENEVTNRVAEAVEQGGNWKNSWKPKEVKSLDSDLIKLIENQKNIWRNSWKSKEAIKEGENGGKSMVEEQGESSIVEEVGGEGESRKNRGRYGRKLTGSKRWEKWKKRKAIKAKEALAREETGGGESENETVVDVNGRVWVKKKVNPTAEVEGEFWAESDVKVPSVVVNPTAEFEEKFRDLSVKNGGARNGQDYLNGGGNERKEGKARGVKENVNVVDDATAESGLQSGDSSRNKKKRNVGKRFRKNKVAEYGNEATDNLNIGKEVDVGMSVVKNVEDDVTAENGQGNGGYGRRNGGGGSVKGYKGKGRVNRGKMQLDSSLVWVRKEDKADACVAGNCLEGVLEKAGEKEKKPGRGRA